MKRIILLELCLLFLATTFQGDNPPPGWYIQQIPVNKNIVDIHFTDTLHGWAVTNWTSSTDTGFVLHTTNGGTNWIINYQTHINFAAVQFIDNNTGYISGYDGFGIICKTTNSGLNWNVLLHNGFNFTDLRFINSDTGWACDDDGLIGIGLLKTTNGGLNWVQQLNNSYKPQRLFFLNKDTGWVMTANLNLYRTLNSGVNWNLMHTFSTTNNAVYSFSFPTIDTGWVIQEGVGIISKTTDGGLNWITQADPNPSGSYAMIIKMFNSKYGYISTTYSKIIKTFDGVNWQRQDGPNGYYSGGGLSFSDSLHGWVSHQYAVNNIASTIDGGGPVLGINNISTEVPKDYELGQNYPNPFNAISKIKYKILKSSNIRIEVMDILGKNMQTLVNKKQIPGTYEVNFNGNSLSSGIYFYSLFADGKKIDTKRMMLLK